MEEDHGTAIAEIGMNDPGTECDSVWSGDGNVCEIGTQVLGEVAHRGFVFLREGAAGGMQSAMSDEDSGGSAEGKVESQEEQ